MFRFFILLIFVVCIPSFCYAQADEAQGVEINLDVLDKYTPPPMFDKKDNQKKNVSKPKPVKHKPKNKIVAKPASKPSSPSKNAQVKAPIPPKKIVPRELNEGEMIQPTTMQILRQVQEIEGEDLPAPKSDDLENKKEEITIEDKSKRVEVDNSQQIEEDFDVGPNEIINIPANGVFEISVPLLASDTGSKQAHSIVAVNFIPRLKVSNEARLEIRSYASLSDQASGDARRLSLSRALALKEYVISKGIDARRIDILPLGDATKSLPKNRFDLAIMYP